MTCSECSIPGDLVGLKVCEFCKEDVCEICYDEHISCRHDNGLNE